MTASAARIAQLETALRVVEKERDELAADVERLCLQSGSSMFDPNYLLTERLRSADSDVKQLRQQLSALKEERDITVEELQQARNAKVLSDAMFSERCKSLERDATFYKERAVKAMAERDQEVENMRAEALGSEARLRELTESLELAQACNTDLEARLGGLQAELDSLRQQHLDKQQAASVEAEAELRQLQGTVHLLEDGAQKLKAQLVEVQAEASHTNKLLKQAHKIEDQLTSQVRELQAELAMARRQLSSGGQSPQSSSPLAPRSSPGSAGGAPLDEPGAAPAGARPIVTVASSSSSPSPSSSPPAALTAPPPPHSPVPSPRGGGGAAARALSAGTTAAVTVTAAEATAPDEPPQPLPESSVPSAVAGPRMCEVGQASASSSAAASPPPALMTAAEAAEEGVGAGAADAAAKAEASHGSLKDRVAELEAALAAARDELSRERATHEDEREQLGVLRTMAHDFKIKLAQATQEKVAALLRAAQLAHTVADAKQQHHAAAAQQQQQPGTPGGGGGVGQPVPTPPQRQASVASERSSRDLSPSPGSSFHLFPASSAPAPATSGQPAPKSLWATWLGGGGGLPPPPPPPPAAAAARAQYAASVASEEGSEADGGGAAATALTAAATAAAASAAAHAATVEAAEGRSRRLASQLERVRSQLAAIDRLAGHVGRCEVRLRSSAALLWSSREEDAPRRWAALGELTRLAEECGALRAEAGLPPPPAAAAAAPPAAGPLGDLPPVVPLAFTEAGALLGINNQHDHRQQQHHQNQAQRHTGSGSSRARGDAGGGDGSGGEYDSSLVCTREAGGVQRRVAEVLLGSIEFGVRSLEQYNHHSAMSSVLYS